MFNTQKFELKDLIKLENYFRLVASFKSFVIEKYTNVKTKFIFYYRVHFLGENPRAVYYALDIDRQSKLKDFRQDVVLDQFAGTIDSSSFLIANKNHPDNKENT